MKFEKKYKILLHKKYFDTGFSLMHYARYPVMLFGIDAAIKSQIKEIAIGALLFGIWCYLFGRYWIKKDWAKAEKEVSNRLMDKLAIELRDHLKKKKRKV